MTVRLYRARPLAMALTVALVAMGWPARAETATAALSGVIRGADRAPLAGARLLAAEADSHAVYRSEPTAADGNFTLTGIAPGRYELAVELDGGLYPIRKPLELVAGIERSLQIAVDTDAPPASGSPAPAAGIWNNPITASALVLGFAIVVGVLVKNATEDEDASTQFQ